MYLGRLRDIFMSRGRLKGNHMRHMRASSRVTEDSLLSPLIYETDIISRALVYCTTCINLRCVTSFASLPLRYNSLVSSTPAVFRVVRLRFFQHTNHSCCKTPCGRKQRNSRSLPTSKLLGRPHLPHFLVKPQPCTQPHGSLPRACQQQSFSVPDPTIKGNLTF